MSAIESALQMLAENPPAFPPGPGRREAFTRLGRFLEAHIRPGGEADLSTNPNLVWKIIEQRLLGVLAAVEGFDTADRMRLWQWYNSGVIIKADDVYFGMDIIPMLRSFGWTEPAGLTARLAGVLDFLLVSHEHPDHYDRALVRDCLSLGKPVCMPRELARRDWEDNPNLYAVDAGWEQVLGDVHIRAGTGRHVWRETYEELPLVYYELECPGGYKMFFGGDIDYTQELKLLSPAPDLVFLPWRSPNADFESRQGCIAQDVLRAMGVFLQRIRPGAIILEHYGELEHVYQGMPASWEIAMDVCAGAGVKCDCLFWGESIALPLRGGST